MQKAIHSRFYAARLLVRLASISMRDVNVDAQKLFTLNYYKDK